MSECSSIAEFVVRARAAQRSAGMWSQERIDQVVATVGWCAYEEKRVQEMTTQSCAETGLGRREDTYARHRYRVLGTLRDMHGARTEGVIDSDPSRGLLRFAKPIGVIASITPVTAPTAAICQNALLALKTRNAIVFCPHPKTKDSARFVTDALRAALDEAGAPPDLVQCVDQPNRECVELLMSSADLIIAAGGTGTVRRAYTSGTPAFGGGAGNAVVIVDETADPAEAAVKLFRGKSFDNGTSCSAESSVVVTSSAWDALIAQLRSLGSYLCTEAESARLGNLMWPEDARISNVVVGQDATAIARLLQIEVPQNTRVLMAIATGNVHDNRFAREKLSPVLALWRYEKFDDAIRLARDITSLVGRGHSCGIFTRRTERALQLAEQVDVSRIMVNQSTGLGNSGSFANGMPFTATLCCGSWGGSITNENITWKHLLNYTWVSSELEERLPNISELFACRHRPGVS